MKGLKKKKIQIYPCPPIAAASTYRNDIRCIYRLILYDAIQFFELITIVHTLSGPTHQEASLTQDAWLMKKMASMMEIEWPWISFWTI